MTTRHEQTEYPTNSTLTLETCELAQSRRLSRWLKSFPTNRSRLGLGRGRWTRGCLESGPYGGPGGCSAPERARTPGFVR
jgi:hypothetical protein